MLLVKDQIYISELQEMSKKMYGKLVKAVVDVEKEVMIVDADLHSDQEEVLLESGSSQTNLWGINLHPSKFPNKEFVEFDSMINIRPSWGNSSRSVDDQKIREKIIKIVEKLVKS